jgi:hypothetical protein
LADNRLKAKIILISLTLLAVIDILCVSAVAVGQQDVVDYYWRKATRSFAGSELSACRLPYSFTVIARTQSLERGKSRTSDSSVFRYFFSRGAQDSTQLINGRSKPVFPIDISVPNVFDSTYIRTLFPNDTGGTELAIGFDTDSSGDPRPIGIVTIDRENCAIRRLHAAYPVKSGYSRFSRSFHFAVANGWIYPDSIVETGSVRAFLLNEDYRIEISISDLTAPAQAPADSR